MHKKGLNKAGKKKPTVNVKFTYNLMIFEESPFHFLTMTIFRVTRRQQLFIMVAETTCTPSSAYFFLSLPLLFDILFVRNDIYRTPSILQKHSGITRQPLKDYKLAIY